MTTNGYAEMTRQHERRLNDLEPLVRELTGDVREIKTNTANMADDIREMRKERTDDKQLTIGQRGMIAAAVIAAGGAMGASIIQLAGA